MYRKQKAAARFQAATAELQGLLDKAAAGKEYDKRQVSELQAELSNLINFITAYV